MACAAVELFKAAIHETIIRFLYDFEELSRVASSVAQLIFIDSCEKGLFCCFLFFLVALGNGGTKDKHSGLVRRWQIYLHRSIHTTDPSSFWMESPRFEAFLAFEADGGVHSTPRFSNLVPLGRRVVGVMRWQICPL